MVLSLIAAIVIGFFSIMIPGFLIALGLLRKTHLHIVEISLIGFILGFVGPATLTWLEAYLIPYVHFFSFSLTLFLINVVILSILGFALCVWRKSFKNFRADYFPKKNTPATEHNQKIKRSHPLVWVFLLVLLLSVFLTRMQSIGIAPQFFEFDPYFDMMDSQSIVVLGQQMLLDPSAWPIIPGGTNHRIEPLIPYIEAFWYDLSNSLGPHLTTFSTTMMSDVSSYYPPIVGALLVFVIFMLLYHEYNEYIALIGAGLTALMPVLFTTFIAGEQLAESWGIFALFFFLAAYMLAVRNPRSKGFAILAGVAFDTNFIGAHYYTVTVGVYVAYIVLQGIIDVIRGTMNKDFYKMNIIVIAVIIVFLAVFLPYSSTLQNRIPSTFGVPITISWPILALVAVAVMDYVPKFLNKRSIAFKTINARNRAVWVALVAIFGSVLLLATPVGGSLQSYITLSIHFTTPSVPLFMTVEEYIPTGILYDYGAAGFGMLGDSLGGVPIIILIVIVAALVLLWVSIFYRKSRTAVLYFAMTLPLTFAGMSEVKYLPHFGVAYILLFCVLLGELIYLAEKNFNFRAESHDERMNSTEPFVQQPAPKKNNHIVHILYAIGIFMISSILGVIYLVYIATKNKYDAANAKTYLWGLAVLFILIIIIASLVSKSVLFGESASYLSAINTFGIALSSTSEAQACNAISNIGDSLGANLYCNVIPPYWLAAMAWIRANVGPNAPRVLAWWDYGDWINWFGNSNAVLRGDNAEPIEDYRTAAQYVLSGQYTLANGATANYTPESLANFMNTNQTKYVLFDQDLISKWQALDFLGCIGANQTTQQFAVAQGAAQSPAVPYLLGNSQCELKHDPEIALVPLQALIGNQSSANINYYCSISTTTNVFVTAPLIVGNNFTNQSVCVSTTPNQNGVLDIYANNGMKLNAVIQSGFYQGIASVQGTNFVEYLVIYLPNGPNDTITDAPTGFYTSNYYKGFFLGKLPGFHLVYPTNSTGGINLVNVSAPVRIYALDNYTGGNVSALQKPSWISNNYTMP